MKVSALSDATAAKVPLGSRANSSSFHGANSTLHGLPLLTSRAIPNFVAVAGDDGRPPNPRRQQDDEDRQGPPHAPRTLPSVSKCSSLNVHNLGTGSVPPRFNSEILVHHSEQRRKNVLWIRTHQWTEEKKSHLSQLNTTCRATLTRINMLRLSLSAIYVRRSLDPTLRTSWCRCCCLRCCCCRWWWCFYRPLVGASQYREGDAGVLFESAMTRAVTAFKMSWKRCIDVDKVSWIVLPNPNGNRGVQCGKGPVYS